MRVVFVVLVLAVFVVVPRTSSAEGDGPARLARGVVQPTLGSRVPSLLRVLGIELVPSARAAECTGEGETCTANEQCCPGLECAGGPPTTCVDED
jgi:hypothetical protein